MSYQPLYIYRIVPHDNKWAIQVRLNKWYFPFWFYVREFHEGGSLIRTYSREKAIQIIQEEYESAKTEKNFLKLPPEIILPKSNED